MTDYNNYYTAISSQYNRIRLDAEEDFNNTISIIINSIIDNAMILDIGCGTGKYGERLQSLNYTVKGIDKAESQVKEARKIIDARIGSSDKLPFADASFDVCLMIMMLHQLNPLSRKKSFEEIHRVLKPKGKLIIKTASHEDIKHRFSSIYFPSAYEEDIKRYPSIETIQSELCYGFSVSVISSKVAVAFEKMDLASKFLKRRTSNLRNVSDEELQAGTEKYLSDYENRDRFIKESYYTFVIAQKL